ncbi:MAG TPA: hypothetical protein VGI58_20935 [Streptosporangiaceae bacterium]
MIAALVSACASNGSAGGGGAPGLDGAGGQPSAPASAATSATTGATSTPAAAAEPGILAVTKAGALVRLDPATGVVRQTLVRSGVLGDEISASAGTIYFAVRNGCNGTIKSVPAGGGRAAVVTAGSLPAISPDGTKLAYASQPSLTEACQGTGNPVPLYSLKIRSLSSGATVTLPQVPASQDTGLPAPISHLSWAADNNHLAVSIASVEDNEGWAVNVVDTGAAHYYLAGSGVTTLPVTGAPNRADSYLREGAYLPDGGLFVSRACCAGFPVRNTSRLMWEVGPDGVLRHQVAVGFADLDHTSLAVSPDGRWLLYLAGNDLYVSSGGARPRLLTTGLIAAAWG